MCFPDTKTWELVRIKSNQSNKDVTPSSGPGGKPEVIARVDRMTGRIENMYYFNGPYEKPEVFEHVEIITAMMGRERSFSPGSITWGN